MNITEAQNVTSSFSYKHTDKVRKFSNILFEDSGISFLDKTIMLVKESCCSCLTLNKDWVINFCEKYLANPRVHGERLQEGINYWKRNRSSTISEVAEDARNNFDIDARIDFVFEDRINDCFYLYSFCSNKKNADKAYSFYNLHRSKLLKFIAFFDREAAPLIAESCKKENMIKLPDYSDFTVQKSKRSYGEELKLENASFEITDREFEVMILYASGCTIKKIAKIMDKSPHSIASYLPNVWNKTNCKNRIDLRQYVVKNGWGNIERFFFNYV